MNAAVGVLMLVLFVVLGVAKAWSEGHMDDVLKGVIWGFGICAWFGVAFYLIVGGAT